MDVLSEVLRSLKTSCTVYYCDQLEPPWVKEFPPNNAASFHQVRRGHCWVLSEGVEEYLGPGDLIFIRPGLSHTLTSRQPGSNDLHEGAETLLLCGYCEFTSNKNTPMASLFPSLSILRDQDLQNRLWLREILSQLSAEFMSTEPGSNLVVQKLSEVLIVELIRMNFGQQQQSHLLKALDDKHIAESLTLLHSKPEYPWTLEELGKTVGLSRAAFAKKFKSLVGLPMFDYLTQLRMQMSQELLTDTNLPLYEIAEQVGYLSELSFTKTFKKRVGVTPSAYRKKGPPVEGE